MMRYLLNGIYLFTLAAAAPWMAWRALRTGRYREGWGAKLFGLVPSLSNRGETIWLHAVSVGEVQLLRTLYAELSHRLPQAHLCISCTTKSGMELAKRLFSDATHFYMPMDFSWAVRRAIRRIHPKMIVLAELELWPNFVAEAKRQGCKVVVVNGRLSERSFRGYGHIGWLMRSTLAKVDWIGAQDTTYAARFRALGAPQEQVSVTGSLKFDGAEYDRRHREVESRRRLFGIESQHRVFVAGSTQSPEEALAIDAFLELKPRFPNLKMILVPRHPERFGEVELLLKQKGVRSIKRSEVSQAVCGEDWEILLGDTIGELRWFWGLAEFGFVGGSFGKRGGQNMIEPAAFGVATSFGPNTKNFRDIVRLLLDANAATVLDEPTELCPWLDSMLCNPRQAIAMGCRAAELAMNHRGATQRTLDVLMPMLGSVQKTRGLAA